MEMQPLGIPEKAETTKWKMQEIVREISIELDNIDFGTGEDSAIQWDKFAEQIIPQLMEKFRRAFAKNDIKFPIVLQTTMKGVCTSGTEGNAYYKNFRTNSIYGN
jgi:hypothetical protein